MDAAEEAVTFRLSRLGVEREVAITPVVLVA
jgi:hypothetical protein